MRQLIGKGILALTFSTLFFSSSLCAQIAVLKSLHLSRVDGYVVNENGKPLANVQVALISGLQPSLAVNTNADGHFDFAGARGEYLFHVKIPGSAIAARQVIVSRCFRARLHRKPLYVMMKPLGCEDCVSSIFTNKGQLVRAIRESSENHD